MTQDKQAKKSGWKAGFGAVDITPPPGLMMSGFAARYQPAAGIHDPLRVRAIALEDGQSAQPVLLLVFDLVGLPNALADALRKNLAGKFGIETGRIILAATHTHHGPILEGAKAGSAEQAYLDGLTGKAIEAAGQALASLEPALLQIGQGQANEAGRNRSRINGPTDPATGVLTVQSVATGELLGCVINYTCHPTVLGPTNLLYTADYPFYTVKAVSEATGLPPEKILFTNGACGDINAGHSPKLSINSPGAGNRTYEAAAQLGGNVGKAAIEALNSPTIQLTPALETATLDVEIEWQSERWPSRENLEIYRRERQAELELALTQNDIAAANNLEQLKGWAEGLLEKPLDASWSLPEFRIDVIQLGELNLVTVPGELFVEYGLALKERMGNPTWILGYTNGSLGYIPTPDAYERQDYEADLAYRYHGYPAPFSSKTGQSIVDTATRWREEKSQMAGIARVKS
jgi:neutral ceramidase